jgi:hypothetical protein
MQALSNTVVSPHTSTACAFLESELQKHNCWLALLTACLNCCTTPSSCWLRLSQRDRKPDARTYQPATHTRCTAARTHQVMAAVAPPPPCRAAGASARRPGAWGSHWRSHQHWSSRDPSPAHSVASLLCWPPAAETLGWLWQSWNRPLTGDGTCESGILAPSAYNPGAV